MTAELKVVKDAYELVKTALPVVARIPRAHRFTLGDRIESRLIDLLELLERARYDRDRVRSLESANERVGTLGMLIRLACDLQLMSPGQYGVPAERLTAMGRQVGGWLKQARPKGGPDGAV